MRQLDKKWELFEKRNALKEAAFASFWIQQTAPRLLLHHQIGLNSRALIQIQVATMKGFTDFCQLTL